MPKVYKTREKIHNGEESNEKNLVCSIEGSLIHISQAKIDGEDIVSLCEGINKVLAHIADTICWYKRLQGIAFAIEEIDVGPVCKKGKKVFIEALHLLPHFIYNAFNVIPIITVFPPPLPYDEKIQNVKEKDATKIMGDKIESLFNKNKNYEDDRYTMLLSFDEELKNFDFEQYDNYPYPPKAKNKPLWDLLESSGFKEIGGSKVLSLEEYW